MRNIWISNGYGRVYHDDNDYSRYNPYEEIQREGMLMRIQMGQKRRHRMTTMTTRTMAPTTEFTQQRTTPRNVAHDLFTSRFLTKSVTWAPRTPVDRAVLQPPTMPSSSSNGIHAMLISILIVIPVLLLALCYKLVMSRRAKRLRQQSNARCGLQRRNSLRERREPDESYNTITTSVSVPLQQQDFDAVFLDSLENISNSPELRSAQLSNNDKPPPYSECTRYNEATNNKHVIEEPPPPYFACHVTYTNPKDAEPKVHILRPNVLNEQVHLSTEIDNARNNLIENELRCEAVTMTTSSNDFAPGMRTELVFDNGKII